MSTWTFLSMSRLLIPRPLVSFAISLTNLRDGCCTLHLYSIIGLVVSIFCLLLPLIYLMKRKRRANHVEPYGEAQRQGEDATTRSSLRASRAMSSTSTHSATLYHPCAQQPQPIRETPPVPIPVGGPRLPLLHSRPSLPLIRTDSLGLPSDTSFCDSPVEETTNRVERTSDSLFNGLPPEVLLMIFQYAFPRHDTRVQSPTPRPFPLRQVCKKWRSMIDDAPEFWLSLTPSLDKTKRDRSVLEWYKKVTRELSAKITAFENITLRLPPWEDTICKDLLRHLVKNVVPKSAALKVMLPGQLFKSDVMMLSSFSPIEVEVRRKPSDGPALKYLRTVDWSMDRPFQLQLPPFLGLPWSSLRALPWDQLTSVSLYLPMTLHDCVFIFDHARSIEHLALRTISDHSSYSSPISYPEGTTDSLSHLRSLTIGAEVSLSTLFRKYPMPQLRDLRLQLGGRETSADLDQLAVHWPQLKSVELDCFLSVDVVNNIVRNLAEVESLVFKGALVGDEAWSAHNTLSSLKHFAFSSRNNAGTTMVTHFARYIFPTSIETVDIPLDPGVIGGLFPSPFDSLTTATLNQPIRPQDFFHFLSLAPNLREGRFKVRDVDGLHLSSPSLSPSQHLSSPSFSHSQHLSSPSFSPSQHLSSPSFPPSQLPPSSRPPPPSPAPVPAFSPILHEIASLDLDLDFQLLHAKSFLDALTLPNLTSLTFKATRSFSDCDLLDFLKRSQCPLAKLSLDCHQLENEGALKILRLLTRTLEDLTIVDLSFAQEFGGNLFLELTHGTDVMKGCLCPRLESLHFSPCADPQLFFEMILSRSQFPSECDSCGGVRKLKSVGANIESRYWRDWNRTEWEQRLRDLGISYDFK